MKILLLSFLISLNANASIKLALNWKAEPQFGGFYAAQVLGFFKEAGVDVEILQGGSGTPTIQILSAGKVEYAIVSGDELVISHDRGAKNAIALFATYQTNPQCIMVHSENPAKDVKSLMQQSDQTLLWQSGLPYALFLKQKYGPMKIKTAPYLGGIGLFQNSAKIAQQCFVTSEPLLAEKNKTAVRTFLIADEGFNPYTTVLVTTSKRLQKMPMEVAKVLKAVRKGWEAYLKDPRKVNVAMGELNKGMDKETFEKSALAQVKLIEPKGGILGGMTAARWQTLIDQMHSLQLIKSKPPVEALFKNLPQ